MTTDELREAYLDFFVSKGSVLKPSDLLVPNDPTVLFTPAGMNQFKREFMGLGDPSFTRATTCQKCIRTGDIENVGRTPRHQTFFEMLGNFSFGDYFKREAIHWAWEFLTKNLKIDPARLAVTVYLDDDEAYNIWRDEIRVPADRITRMGEDDNFWPAGAPTHGPDGVCGPCSEIFYRGDGIEEVEIWNLVFTQFNRVGPGQLEPLPKKNIDTGMGLERMAAAIQGVSSNFEIDIFKPIVAATAREIGIQLDREGKSQTRDFAVSHEERIVRRIADHVRALTFCIHENVKPGPNEQGYILRLLLRRALVETYGIRFKQKNIDPFLYKIVPVVAEVMGRPYPELRESVPRIQTVIREEEEQFYRTLETGMKFLHETVRKTRAAGSDVIPGNEVFTLHATYGIPIEITESLAVEENLTVDKAGFEREMEAHSLRSRGTTEAAAVFTTGPLHTLKAEYHHGSEFLGYETTEAEGKVIGIIAQGMLAESGTAAGAQVALEFEDEDGTTETIPMAGGIVDKEDKPIVLVLDRTPFYGESGGQVGDTGTIEGEGFTFQVLDTKRDEGFTLHIGRVTEGIVSLGDSVKATVDVERREAIRRAHSATHVLHHSLHIHLGKHAQQAGSKVEPDRLRFDFSNPEAVGRDRLKLVEDTVNARVLKGEPITWRTMPIAEAKTLGAMALFGEKYPEIVRVVEMGEFSRELCGGTHLDNVGKVGLFKVIGEESVSAGTRRITALTGQAALDLIRVEEETLAELSATLKVPVPAIADRVAALVEEVKSLKKQLATRKADDTPKVAPDDLLAGATAVGDAHVIAASLVSSTADEMRQLADVLRRKAPTGLAVLLASAAEGKVTLIAALTPDLVAKGLHAGNWLKEVAPVVGGGGGGRPDLAQAGGKDAAKIPDALARALEVIQSKLGG
jgi:alanyl-tRNA synthetase